ncbi:MAG: hypothetical protein WCB79_07610 [Halobacteriota archaeon]
MIKVSRAPLSPLTELDANPRPSCQARRETVFTVTLIAGATEGTTANSLL